MSPSPSDVSVVTVTWNGKSHLQTLLPTLAATGCGEILVVDNGSSDGSQALVRQSTVAGLGVREGVVVGGLSVLGLPLSQAVAVALLSRCGLWAISLVGGILYLVRGKPSREHLLG